MTSSPTSYTIRPLTAQEWQQYRQIRLRSLADYPNAFGSTFAAEKDRSDEAWATRLLLATSSGKDYPLIAKISGVNSGDNNAFAGLLWAKEDATDTSVVNIFQMWVAPEYRGQGVATKLLREAIFWARSRCAKLVQLGVTCGDSAAIRLYLREGFRAIGSPEPLRPDSTLLAQTMRLVLE
ncbi:GNAT family N-acetyltransferase [Undibacterium sp. FT147W]|uniref:GNAT family N-acetyltransferase n=1 Tax=Undibacterium rivi TaxID=2828729 RepID=A0ABS5GYD3_9BURK|nr:GNAT family N-acetyltransferase [Undibacterium rivi]MBR7791388.1 GNAT family N-acetyltransferase [Undibacterium rivi]